MRNNSINKYLIADNTFLVEAMKTIDSNFGRNLFVIDGAGKLKGCLSDGDIRRWIIKTGNLDSEVKNVMNSNVRYLYEAEASKAKDTMTDNQITSIPIINDAHEIVDIKFIDSEIRKNRKDRLSGISVIVMAGGMGTRLYPYTKILPKPLIPIGDVPIIERIMDQFFGFGIEEFYLVVNYRKEMIRSYFEDVKREYKISYVNEESPLGTAGGISLIEEKISDPIIVTNCDIIIDVDYSDVIEQHKISENDVTVISSLKSVTLPYGVLNLEKGGTIKSIDEKPVFTNLINTGVYVINEEARKLIPKDREYNMTDFLDDTIKRGMKVGLYPVGEEKFWDMGEFESMKNMEEKFFM